MAALPYPAPPRSRCLVYAGKQFQIHLHGSKSLHESCAHKHTISDLFSGQISFFSALTCFFFPLFSSYQSPSIRFSCVACDHRVCVCVCVCSQDNSVHKYNMLFFPCCDMIDTLFQRRVITGHLLTSVSNLFFFWGPTGAGETHSRHHRQE